MKHVFVINPAAGPLGSENNLKLTLKEIQQRETIDIHYTSGVGDAERFVREFCQSAGEPVRFYACGGDGTLNEVVNGAADFEHVVVGCYPCGSGNDFVKAFGGAERFLDVEAQMRTEPKYIDLIRVDGKYCVNVCNFGFDAAVASTMQEVKNKFLFSGKSAYFAGVIKAFMKNVRTKCSIKVDGEELSEGIILLCTIANGQYVGGSYRCAPRALTDDGLLEICVVKPISRARFISLIGPYSKGEHLDNSAFDDFIHYRRGKVIEVESPESEFMYTLDGELEKRSRFKAEIVPSAIKFIVPE